MPKPKPKKMGNPNNQTVDGFRGVSAETLRAKRLAAKTPAGQEDANRLVSYDPEAVRAAVEALLCPFCGVGPFKVVARHVSLMHGVSPSELRDMAGFLKADSICDPAYSQRKSEQGKQRRDLGYLPPRSLPGQKNELSVAAKKAASERCAELGRTSKGHPYFGGRPPKKPRGACASCGGRIPDTRPTRARTCSDECLRAIQSENMKEWRRRFSDGDRLEIARLYGAGLSQSQIAERFGVTQTCIGKILRADNVSTRPFDSRSGGIDA